MYGTNTNGVKVSLLDDYFMKRFLLFYKRNEKEVSNRYDLSVP